MTGVDFSGILITPSRSEIRSWIDETKADLQAPADSWIVCAAFHETGEPEHASGSFYPGQTAVTEKKSCQRRFCHPLELPAAGFPAVFLFRPRQTPPAASIVPEIFLFAGACDLKDRFCGFSAPVSIL